jgi:hypothetical protein
VRRAGMKARALSFYLKTQEFTYHGVQLDLPTALDTPPLMLACIRARLDEVYARGILYRASGVTLRSLETHESVTPDLFGVFAKESEKGGTFRALDSINKRYGRSTMYLGSSMRAHAVGGGGSRAGGEKKSLNIPYLGIAR